MKISKELKIRKTKNIKVLFCPSDNNAVSGAFLQMLDLIKELKTRYSITPFIVLPSYQGTGKSLLEKEGLDFTIIPQEDWVIPKKASFFKRLKKVLRIFKKNVKAFFKLKSLIKKEKIDIVHLNTIWTFIGGLAALYCHTKLVWHIREALGPAFSYKIVFPFGFNLINKAHKIISISNAVLNSYPKLNLNKVKVIYDGIDERNYINDKKQLFQNKIIKFTCVGAIYKQKGQEDLIEACALLIKNNIKNWHLDLIGDGAIDEIKQKIISLDLENYIDVLGPQKEIYKFLSKTDIGFTPSWYEGFGRTAAEMTLSGSLLICSNAGAFPEIYSDKKTALIHQVKSPESIYEVIHWALSHKKLCKKIAKNGQKNALQHFTIDENAKNVYKEYIKVLEKK